MEAKFFYECNSYALFTKSWPQRLICSERGQNIRAMFKKQFKLRSQNQLKSSEKKKFASDLRALFPALTDNDVSSLLGNKDNVVKMKVITFKEEDVDVFCVNKCPVCIDVLDRGLKLPTVYMLWRFPHLLPVLTTNKLVLNKLKNGADLFFPGIYTEGLLSSDSNFDKNDPICVNLIENKAAMAIGSSLISKGEILRRNEGEGVGKLVQIHHTIDDYLCKLQNEILPLQLGPPDWALPKASNETSGDSQLVENNSDLLGVDASTHPGQTNIEPPPESGQVSYNESVTEQSQTGKDTSDELLEYCFLKAIKTMPKTAYPVLPATFYAKYILANVPSEKILNMKKTKWKKFTIFLQEKNDQGLIKLEAMPKNEFMIGSGNPDHPQVKSFVDPYNTASVVVAHKSDIKPTVQQVYLVSARTLPFFSKFGLKKNDELTRNDVRNNLNYYIKTGDMADPSKPEMVALDPLLHQILKQEVMSRADLLAGLLQKMSVEHKVSNCGSGETIFHKGKMPMIEFETCLRTGNKKVTLISNLECYGVHASNFARELQHKAAASTTMIASVPGKKGPQVQVQGNQVAHAFAILKEKYKLNEKCMKGLEKAVKLKNKK